MVRSPMIPGIVHQDIEAAALLLYLLHHRFDLLRLSDVALDYERLPNSAATFMASALFWPCASAT